MAGIKRPAYDDHSYGLGDTTPSKRRRPTPPVASSTSTALERRLHQNSPSPFEWVWSSLGAVRNIFAAPKSLPLPERSPAKPLLLGFQTSYSRRDPAAGTTVGGGGVISRLPSCRSDSNGVTYLSGATKQGAIDLTGDNEVDDEIRFKRPYQPEYTHPETWDTSPSGHKKQDLSHRRGMMVESKRANRPRTWDQQPGEVQEELEPRRPTRRVPKYDRQGNNTLRELEVSLSRAKAEAEMGETVELRQKAEKDIKSLDRYISGMKEEMKKKAEEERRAVVPAQPMTMREYEDLLNRNIKTSLFREPAQPKPVALDGRRTPVPSQYKKPKELADLVARLHLKNEEDAEKARKLSKPAVPTNLKPEQLKLVNETLANPRFKTPKNGNESIEPHNMKRLKDGQWLSDDIMAYYTMLINARNAADTTLPSLHCFNTFFYSKIDQDPTSHAVVRRWTKKVDIFAKDMVLVPINIGNMHWVGAVINFKQKRIEYFDSMGVRPGAEEVFQNLRQYVAAEHQDKKGSPYDMSEWVDSYKTDAPRQNNGSDCGVFSCQTLELVARGADPIDKGFEFGAQNMSFFRKLMVYEITKGELMKRW